MKERLLLVFVMIPSFFLPSFLHAQNIPEWTKDMVPSVDSAYLFPVRLVNDLSHHPVVLTTFNKTDALGFTDIKIYLYKYDEQGNIIWSVIFDNDGTGKPQGFDMVIDDDRNIYIAGGLMESGVQQPLVMKLDSNGAIVWKLFSTTAFSAGHCEQILVQNNLLYVRAEAGVAVFDPDGNEQWSMGDMYTSRMAVDHEGRIVLTTYPAPSHNLFRYDADGTLEFSDSTTMAKRIAIDSDNNIYLLTDVGPHYVLTKYDSDGNFSWIKNDLPVSPPFGDIGFEVITDYYNNVFVVGLSDTMFKFTPQGDLLWKKSMDGLDSYLITVQIAFAELLFVAGTIPGGGAYDMKVAAFNDLGAENWSGYYSSNNTLTEFSADLDIDHSGVYVIEDNNSHTTLVKFENPHLATDTVDFDLICVDSVWYDPLDPVFINVTVFNGNIPYLNYPRVQIVAPNGDTISNVYNLLWSFAHVGNSYQTYRDTIIVPGITDFDNYTFLMTIAFPDTTVQIDRCLATAIPVIAENGIHIYPNPVHDYLFIEGSMVHENTDATIYNAYGELVFKGSVASRDLKAIHVSGLPGGVYFLLLNDTDFRLSFKFVKQ